MGVVGEVDSHYDYRHKIYSLHMSYGLGRVHSTKILYTFQFLYTLVQKAIVQKRVGARMDLLCLLEVRGMFQI